MYEAHDTQLVLEFRAIKALTMKIDFDWGSRLDSRMYQYSMMAVGLVAHGGTWHSR